jgi:hypothetical protein
VNIPDKTVKLIEAQLYASEEHGTTLLYLDKISKFFAALQLVFCQPIFQKVLLVLIDNKAR